jgi:uncharacterized damage-inducible protein DinB
LASEEKMATAVSPIQRLHQHRAWANENLVVAAEGLSEEQLKQEFAIGQGSVWKSLVHLYAAEYVWLEALLGNEDPIMQGDLPGKIPGNQLGDGKIASLAELRQKWTQLQERWELYLVELKPEALDELVYKIVSSTRQRLATRRSDVLLHVATHAHYTSAQVVNMLRQLGVEKLPETMLISLARKEASRQ